MMYRILALVALFACQTEAFVAPASAVVTRTAVRSAEPAMFGGGKKSAPKKVVKKAASMPAAKKVAKKPVAKKVVKKVVKKPVAKKVGEEGRQEGRQEAGGEEGRQEGCSQAGGEEGWQEGRPLLQRPGRYVVQVGQGGQLPEPHLRCLQEEPVP